jgi:hypothetical protein
VREYGRTGEEEGKREGGEGMIRNDRPSPHQKILDPPLQLANGPALTINRVTVFYFM